jgi:Uncharacterized conserved protein
MSLIDDVSKLAQKFQRSKDFIQTEEATKTAYVMPMLQALGYDVFDPEIVIPEFIADVGIKKGEKVDYALCVNGKIAILVECKPVGTNLGDVHASQLYRYFSVTEARFSILTNGMHYWFFSDLDEPNKMDEQPFFRFDLSTYREGDLVELEKFAHQNFDLDGILGSASCLKYTSLVMEQIRRELELPTEEMVRLFAKRVYDGNFSQAVREKFSQIVASSFREVIKDIVSQRLKDALRSADAQQNSQDVVQIAAEPDNEIQTTEDELEAVRIIKAIACEVVSPARIALRDAKTYCAVLLDDNNRKPIARLYFNSNHKKLGVFTNKIEEKISIDTLDDIYKHAAHIRTCISVYQAHEKTS